MQLIEVKHYMWALLQAVGHLTEHGVMHRDIKPANFLYDKWSRSGQLIDFGLAELVLDNNYELTRQLKDEDLAKLAKKLAHVQKQ